MSIKNQYSFLSWARKGMVNSISPVPSGTARASIQLDVVVNGQSVSQTIQVLGPQDVIGINQNMVVRTEPRNWITDFEPNYLPFIEFYEEDFPWRYTPQLPAGAKLQPWLTLVVLKSDEFELDSSTTPLPSFKIKKDASQLFPPSDQLWAWAHVHVNGDISQASDLTTLVNQDPDQAHSRLFSARKLQQETAYNVFLVPTYELGRLSGLGLAADDASLFGKISYDGKTLGTAFPYYYNYYFHTGTTGDFEYLLSLLTPYTADQKIGRRDMDVSNPGFDSQWLDVQKILAMEGALKSPKMVPDNWPAAVPPIPQFQQDVQRLINLPEKLVEEGQVTPLVTIPFYGSKHILETTIEITDDPSKDFWITELNRDPRNRAASGLGTKVIQSNQESYMLTAWQQVNQVNELNRQIRLLQLAAKASIQLFTRNLSGLVPSKGLGMTQLLHSKITNSPTTIRYAVKQSALPLAALSGTFRRITRPAGNLMKRWNGKLESHLIAESINAGEITAAPPLPTPKDTNVWSEVAGAQETKGILPGWLQKLLEPLNPWLILAIFIVLAIIFLLLGIYAVGIPLAVLGIAGYIGIRYAKSEGALTGDLLSAPFTPDIISKLPVDPNFSVIPANAPTAASQVPGFADILLPEAEKDSADASRFKTALSDFFQVTSKAPAPLPVPATFDLAKAQARIMEVTEPTYALSKRVSAYALFPGIETVKPANFFDVIVPVMAYPDFKQAMYVPLRDLGTDNVCPGISAIPTNKITLLLTNTPFVESYMVGLNHEMGRELLWKEYPTDQRGSYFRTFWEKTGFVVTDPKADPKDIEEQKKDIPKIHTWGKHTQLGSHPNPAPANGLKVPEKVVLTIRSDIFKRYPNTVVFAQKAKWKDQATQEREMDETLEINFDQPYDNSIIKTPMFGADFLPDIKCFGFDLTLDQARGDNNDPGWYFVIMERPGEPRFGMDELPADFNFANPPKLSLWNDLHWGYMVTSKTAYDNLEVLKLNELRTPVLNGPLPTDPDDVDQRNEDNTEAWGTQAGSLAYILYQAPVKVAVHATDMLDGVS